MDDTTRHGQLAWTDSSSSGEEPFPETPGATDGVQRDSVKVAAGDLYEGKEGVQESAEDSDEDESKRTVRFSDLGIGRAVLGDDRRDFTVKASRRPAPPPPSPFPVKPIESATTLSRSNSTPVTTPRPTHHRHSTSTSSIHAFIPEPTYPIRSQPIGLRRSPSFTDNPNSPTISGGLTRRLSVSSTDGEPEEDELEARIRPLKHRSDSLPIFPPVEVLALRKEPTKITLADLPTNPKAWLPSHLSIYISHCLQLHPLLEADITAFIRASHLSGRTFLRLRDDEMEELGLNVRWRGLLSEARERLRREALGGRIWGFEGARIEDDESKLIAESEEERDEWKKSWRRNEGTSSRGRVKGMAQAFEAPEEEGTPVAMRTKRSSRIFLPSSPHRRSESVESSTSTASIDSGSSVDYEHREEGEYQGKIGSHDPEARPYERVRKASDGGVGSRMSVRELVDWTVPPSEDGILGEKEVEGTVRSGSAGRSTLEGLFGIEIGSARREERTAEEMEKELERERDLEEDILVMQVGGKKGSMVLVKRSQLEDLQRRMEEVEAQLAVALSPSRLLSPTPFEVQPPLPPNALGAWVLSSFSALTNTPPSLPDDRIATPASWTALGGYCLAASIGIGIVAGEVVVSKLFGIGRR